jgi:hypothetical protein
LLPPYPSSAIDVLVSNAGIQIVQPLEDFPFSGQSLVVSHGWFMQ